MKKFLMILFITGFCGKALAQKIEVNLQANSGLFRYGGNQAESSSSVIGDAYSGQNFTYNPYGNKFAVSYGAALQAQVVSSVGFIAGLGGGYEILRSKIDVTYYSPSNAPFTNTISYPASGQTILQSNFINLNPYVGYRVDMGIVKVDILPGLDIAFKTSAREHGKVFYTGGTATTNLDRRDIKHDTRIRIGLAACYNRFGINAGYSRGLVNQQTISTDQNIQDAPFNDRKAKSELIRFGISYRIF